jgi:hypothetical protein
MECISERQVNVAEQPVPADAGRRLGLSSVAFGPARLHFVVKRRVPDQMNVARPENALLIRTRVADVGRQSFAKGMVLLLALALPLTVNAQAGRAPTVTVDPASRVSGTSALITGTINPNALPTVWRVAHGTNSAYYTNVLGALPADATAISVRTNLYWLDPSTSYHYQLVASNSAGQASSPDMSFTTGGANVPSVGLFGPEQITTSDIAVSGVIIPNGLVTSFSLFWGTNTAYDHNDGWVTLPAQDTWILVGGSMLGLSPGTTYHCQLVASNSDGYGYSADMTLTTLTPPPPPQSPTVITGPATSITDISAYLTGSIAPNGATADYTFLWGATTAYGNTTGFPIPPLNYGPQNVGASIGGLRPGTTYHFQLTATNGVGIGLGQDQTFTTLSVGAVEDQVSTLTFSVLRQFTDSEEVFHLRD